jgi:CRISPR-associated protein Cmr2
MQKYLFMVSIGPVQDFIASARRTGDLQFGSWLLSELAKAAAKSIAADNHLERLIFPAPTSIADLEDTGTLLNVANKIVAIIDDSPQTVGDAVQTAINTRLLNIQQRSFQGMGPIDDEKANKQIKDLVEYFWVAVPYNTQTQAYVDVRHTLEAIMAARKNTRDFSKVEWGSNMLKSSIDGQLESVIPDKKYYQHGDSAVDREKKSKALYIDYEAKPAERLSGVDLLKRRGRPVILGAPVESFPSTSHMATLPFLARLDLLPKTVLPKIQIIWNTYISTLEKIALSPDLEQIPYTFSPHAILGKYEGSLLFEERLVEVVDVTPNNESQLQAVKKALQAFYREVDTVLGKARPSPYYAILLADGDRMGKVIDNQKDAEGHLRLSQALDGFADSVQRSIVKNNQGALIYAGGDDVLAFVPVHTVLACARELHQKFDEKLHSFTDAQNQKPTLSVGIAIVHHLDSLQDSLSLARAAEKKAKNVKGKNGLQDKNGLAVTVSKRGGIDYSVVGQWGEIGEDLETIKREGIDTHIDQLVPFCVDDSIPDGMAYELRELAQRIAVPKENKDFGVLQKVIQAEAKRILERKLAPLTEAKKKEVMAVLGPKLGIEGEKTDTSKAPAIKLEDFTKELLLAQLLADAQKLAKKE